MTAGYENDAPRFTQRRGLGASRGWDVRMGDEEDYEEIATFVKSLGGSMNSDLSSFSWHIAESSVDERILGCIGTQLIDRVATIGFVAVRTEELGTALLSVVEGAARAMAAAKCRVLPGSTLGIDNERNWLGKRGYDDKGVRVLCDDDERDVADEKVASEDPFLTQLEIAASMKELATSLLDNLPDNQEAAPTTTADENIEDIVSDLLSALKTDQGRVEFRQLASKQALKAQQQRLQQLGDVSQTNQSATTTTVGNARAFAELLCVDASSVMIGANPR